MYTHDGVIVSTSDDINSVVSGATIERAVSVEQCEKQGRGQLSGSQLVGLHPV